MSDLKHEVIAERWAALIKERMDSGMTIKEWCRERNVKESQYYYWLKTLRRDEADAAEQDLQGLRLSWSSRPSAKGRRLRLAGPQPSSAKAVFL